MAFDFKKEYRQLYAPEGRPELVTVPPMRYAAVRGEGDPNRPDGAYQQAVRVLYGISYTLKTSWKKGHRIEGFFEYVVPPLEGFWQQVGVDGVDYGRKEDFHWISAIRLPDFVTEADLAWAAEEAERRKQLDCSAAELWTVEEGLCVQMLHTGPFEGEPATVAAMEDYLRERGCESGLSESRLHHEIYLSDARRTPPERWRTIIRHPIKQRGT